MEKWARKWLMDLEEKGDRVFRIRATERKHAQRKKYTGYVGKTPQIVLETPKRGSSCRCCSNPRRTWKGEEKLTIQERRKEWENNERLG
jgi:hypothetical protein